MIIYHHNDQYIVDPKVSDQDIYNDYKSIKRTKKTPTTNKPNFGILFRNEECSFRQTIKGQLNHLVLIILILIQKSRQTKK